MIRVRTPSEQGWSASGTARGSETVSKVILVVEDEPNILDPLEFLLERIGLTVDSVTDGAAACRRLDEARPDLILLDVMIPNIDGFEVLRTVRSRFALDELPVLMLSAKGQEADRQKAMALGANDFITKPFSNQDLINRIRRHLGVAE
jgi:DNA-binding response OmpR family regulator